MSRTPFRFSPYVERVFRLELQGYQKVLDEATSDSLVYLYRREAREGLFYFILVQASRFAGRFVTEVALSSRPVLPYSRWTDVPCLAVDGVRERVPVLLGGRDRSYRYGTAQELEMTLRMNVVSQSQAALRTLHDGTAGYLHDEQERWRTVYHEWERQDAPGLEGGVEEEELLDYSVRFARLLGPLRFRYSDPRFLRCHRFLFVRGLQLLPPSPPRPQPVATRVSPVPDHVPAQDPQVPPPLADPIAALTGRQAQSLVLEPTPDPAVWRREFAFLKSLAATEAFYPEPARVGHSAGAPG